MKKYQLRIVMAVFALIAVLPLRVSAAEEGIQKLPENGTASIEIEIPQAYGEKVSSIQFSLAVAEQNGEPADTGLLEKIETISFLPSVSVSSRAKICEPRYNRDTGVLNVYIAGTEPLFSEEDTLTVGTVGAVYREGESGDLFLKPLADSLKVVKGTVLKTIEDDEIAVRISVLSEPTGPAGPGVSEKPSVDKTRLQAILEQAAGYKEADYTGGSYGLLKKAMEEGRRVLDDPEATQEEVDQAVAAIELAIGRLIPVTETSAQQQQNPSSEAQNQNSKAVSTGDTNRIWFYTGSGILCGIAVIIILSIKYRKREKSWNF